MKIIYLLGVLWLGFALSACSKSEETAEEHLLSSQQRALEKAKQVNKVIDDAEQKTRKQIEESFK